MCPQVPSRKSQLDNVCDRKVLHLPGQAHLHHHLRFRLEDQQPQQRLQLEPGRRT